MGEIVNLNRARKGKAKADARTVAAGNRVKFGLSKAQRTAAARERAAIEKAIDGAKLDAE